MASHCSTQVENESNKKVEVVEEVDPREAFRQVVLDGKWTCLIPSDCS